MLSKWKNSFLNRSDIRLTIYYTFILLCLFVLLASFFLYRLHHNLIKQIDHVLRDEVIELAHEIEEEFTKSPGSGQASAKQIGTTITVAMTNLSMGPGSIPIRA